MGFLKSIFMSLCVLIMVCFSGCRNESDLLKMNWDVTLSQPKEVETIYRYEYREGDDFEIWKYTEEKAQLIKENDSFEVISEDNISIVEERMEEYYSGLNDGDKTSFNNNFSAEDVIKSGNYYCIKVKNEDISWNKSFLILVLDVESNNLYYFNHIR